VRTAFPEQRSWHVCHETIYLGALPRRERRSEQALTPRLRTGRRLRKGRRWPDARSVRSVPTGCSSIARPAVVELRSRIGDWEGDVIVGRMSQSAIGTLVLRSRLVRLVHLSNAHSTERFRVAMTPVLDTSPSDPGSR
jgi:IS30 family transposase